MYSTTKKHVEISGNQWSHKCISRRPVTPVREAEELDYYSSPMQVSKADELLPRVKPGRCYAQANAAADH